MVVGLELCLSCLSGQLLKSSWVPPAFLSMQFPERAEINFFNPPPQILLTWWGGSRTVSHVDSSATYYLSQESQLLNVFHYAEYTFQLKITTFSWKWKNLTFEGKFACSVNSQIIFRLSSWRKWLYMYCSINIRNWQCPRTQHSDECFFE